MFTISVFFDNFSRLYLYTIYILHGFYFRTFCSCQINRRHVLIKPRLECAIMSVIMAAGFLNNVPTCERNVTCQLSSDAPSGIFGVHVPTLLATPSSYYNFFSIKKIHNKLQYFFFAMMRYISNDVLSVVP